jgi:hypothetical protein
VEIEDTHANVTWGDLVFSCSILRKSQTVGILLRFSGES